MELCFPSTIFFMLFLFLQLHNSAYGNDEKYEQCKKSFQCGNVTLSYPFYDEESRPLYCGYPGFKIICRNGMPEISMSAHIYYIRRQDATSPTIFVAMQSYWQDLCPLMLSNTSINLSLYRYTAIDENITIVYNCPTVSSFAGNQIYCNKSTYYSYVGYIMTQDSDSSAKSINETCPHSNLVSVPVVHFLHGTITDAGSLLDAFHYGFELEWIAENELCDGCRRSRGVCGYDTNQTKSVCYCTDRPYDSKCSAGAHECSNIPCLDKQSEA
ncbi:hypothetical protein RND81_10G121400 [Saponaria officinalis]|uniref:non-specific serine/threonine protein kinase n=1 Tax=Saponaria officinalis TaxID=3572 RepID=A0AAW1I402_SAPOF